MTFVMLFVNVLLDYFQTLKSLISLDLMMKYNKMAFQSIHEADLFWIY